LSQMVFLGGLVVDRRDPAVGVGAERVLRWRIRVSTRIRNRRRAGLDDTNVQGLAIRLTQDLVERTVIGSVQRTRGTVGGHAGVAGSAIDVTRPVGPGHGSARPGTGLLRYCKRGAHHGKRQYEHRYKTDSRFHAHPICVAKSFAVFRRNGLVFAEAVYFLRKSPGNTYTTKFHTRMQG